MVATLRRFSALRTLKHWLTFGAAAGAVLVLARPASAVELGYLRALQRGPIGDSPQFADIDKLDAEVLVEATRDYGSYQANGDSDSKTTGDYFKTRIAAGGGWTPTKNFTVSGYVDSTLYSTYTEEQSQSPADAKLDDGIYKHELSLFAVYRAHPLYFGGGIGLLVVGSEDKEFDYQGSAIKEKIGTAAMPLLRLFAGFTTKEFDGGLGLRLFSQGSATIDETYTGQADHQFDVNRKNPGEIYADGRIKFKEATLAASLAYVLTGQATEQLDEFSARYATVGTHQVRVTGMGERDKDTFRIGVGGRFDPVKVFGILGGLTYTSASYASPENVSLEENNLGGVRVDLGADLHISEIKGFFRASYTIASDDDYTQPDSNRDPTNRDRTLRPIINNGDSVTTTEGAWSVLLGGGIAL